MEGLADADELHEMTKDSLRRAVREGDVNTGSCMCGQIAGLIDQVKPCREIIEDIDKEASQLLNRASSFLD